MKSCHKNFFQAGARTNCDSFNIKQFFSPSNAAPAAQLSFKFVANYCRCRRTFSYFETYCSASAGQPAIFHQKKGAKLSISFRHTDRPLTKRRPLCLPPQWPVNLLQCPQPFPDNTSNVRTQSPITPQMSTPIPQ